MCCLIAVNALAALKELLNSSFGKGEAMWISALEALVLFAYGTSVVDAVGVEQFQYKRHSDVSAKCRLLEIVSSRIIVNVYADLVYAGQGMEDRKRGFCILKLT